MYEQYIQQALEIVKAQAGVRSMSEEEIVAMIHNIAASLSQIASNSGNAHTVNNKSVLDKGAIMHVNQYTDSANEAVRENSIVCLECGKSFRILTKRHLALHNLTVEEYKEKYGYHRNIPLVCRALQRERKEIMTNMKLWERRQMHME